MSEATAAAALQSILDRVAKGRQNSQANFATGDDFWTQVDGAADETFENRVKGSDMTALDSALAAGSVWSVAELRQLYVLINSYVRTDLSYANITAYLATKGWRVPFEAAEALAESLGEGARLAPYWVFPKGTMVASESDPSSAGLHIFGTWTGASTYASTDGATPSTTYAPIMCVSREATPGDSSAVVTVTLQDATTKDVSLVPSATQYAQVVVGQQAIGAAGAAAGQKDIPMAATGQFKAGEYILVEKADGSASELALIASITTNTKLVVTTNLINSFAENDLVFPMFTNITRKSGTLTGGKHLDFYARPDRTIAL